MKALASCFADLRDLAAFEKAKRQGLSDLEAFKVGDNGVGCWGDKTAQDHSPMVAIPPDDMINVFGSIRGAKRRKVRLKCSERPFRECTAIIADRMPWRRNIKNGNSIDLNPACLKALGLPVQIDEYPVEWWPV